MRTWYAHLTWTSPTTAGLVTDTVLAISSTIYGWGDGPGIPGYVLAPDDTGTWRAGFAVTADSISDAATAAATMLSTAALAAGQPDANISRLEVLDDTQRDRWVPDLPALAPRSGDATPEA